MSDGREALYIAHRSDGTLTRRPMSPHLQVYRPQITSALSILNRVSGVAISFGTLLMVAWLVAAASSPGAFALVQWFAGSWLGLLLLFGWSLALAYHFFAGLRHLAWDGGYGFKLPTVHRTGWLAVSATLVAVALIWISVIVLWPSHVGVWSAALPHADAPPPPALNTPAPNAPSQNTPAQ